MIEKIQSAMISAGTLWVLVLMLVLSVVSLAIMFERAWLYWSLRDNVSALMTELSKLLRAGDLVGAKKRLESSPSAEAAVVVAGLIESPHGVEAAEEAMAGASALQRMKLEKRLSFLGTLGNNAPFIGLLGTVIGILSAFDELGHKNTAKAVGAAVGAAASATGGGLAPEGVMLKISEALVATGVGLFIAIPAVAAFNAFQRIVKSTFANTDAMGHMLLSHLKSNDFAGAEELLAPAVGKVTTLAASAEKAPKKGADKSAKSAAADADKSPASED